MTSKRTVEDLLMCFTKAPSLKSFESTPALIEAALCDPTCSSVGTVLVLYTGGTIGMRSHNGVYEPEADFLVEMVMSTSMFFDKSFIERNQIHVNYYNEQQTEGRPSIGDSSQSVFNPWPLICMPPTSENRRIFFMIAEYKPLLDSSNLTIDNWVRIAQHIKLFYDKFDGFVILHGTDTLAYGASFLSFILEGLCKPVILTGSQIPIGELRSDGRENFLGSLLIAGGEQVIPEVCVYFNNKLMRGNRVVKSSASDLDAFTSPNYPPLVEMGLGINFHFSNILQSPSENNKLKVVNSLCRNVVLLRMFPSITVETVKAFFEPPIEGVILQTYGAGNVPGRRKDLMEIFQDAIQNRGIVILNITQCWSGTVRAKYSTGAILAELGVIPCYDMTPEAALAKLAFVLGCSKDPKTRRRLLLSDLRGEVTLPAPLSAEVAAPSTSGSKTEVGAGDDGDDAEPPEFSLRGLPRGQAGVAAVVTRLGQIFSSATHEGPANVWAYRILPYLFCRAAESNDCERLVQLFSVTHTFEMLDSEHRRALHAAAGSGQEAACRLLLEHGAEPNAQDLWGRTPLAHAIRGDRASPALVEMLCVFGAQLPPSPHLRAHDVNQAAMLGKVSQLKLYKLAGMTLQELDGQGRAPLHTAVCHRQVDAVAYLIATEAEGGAGVDVLQRTSYGTTAFEEAAERNLPRIMDMLRPFNPTETVSAASATS